MRERLAGPAAPAVPQDCGANPLTPSPGFRDRLREDPALRELYVARKRESLAQGITHSGDYSEAKGSVIQGILEGSG